MTPHLVELAGGRKVERFGSIGVTALPVLRASAHSVTSLRIEPGGDRVRTEICAGQAVVFAAGEEHETGTDTGLTALAIESDDLTAIFWPSDPDCGPITSEM